ncbi:SRPBCC family protein [Halorussus caseinilyticus]|uniref:SRPBCC domain-containing protein n=1 Tax=Halorussus caseinilyticus TaxID=3034025 RepID=A0ABD5WPB6_9EURY
MREVEVSAFVPAPPASVERALTPETVVEYEGSFEVRAVESTDDGRTVTASARGLTMHLDFEERENGLVYRQRGDAGPFESMETEVTVEPENEGSRVTMRSSVSLDLPVTAVSDRIAAWKRKGNSGGRSTGWPRTCEVASRLARDATVRRPRVRPSLAGPRASGMLVRTRRTTGELLSSRQDRFTP